MNIRKPSKVKLKKLLSKNRIEDLFEELMEDQHVLNTQSLFNKTTLQSAKYYDLKERLEEGIVSDESYNLEVNKIRKSLISLIDMLPEKTKEIEKRDQGGKQLVTLTSSYEISEFDFSKLEKLKNTLVPFLKIDHTDFIIFAIKKGSVIIEVLLPKSKAVLFYQKYQDKKYNKFFKDLKIIRLRFKNLKVSTLFYLFTNFVTQRKIAFGTTLILVLLTILLIKNQPSYNNDDTSAFYAIPSRLENNEEKMLKSSEELEDLFFEAKSEIGSVLEGLNQIKEMKNVDTLSNTYKTMLIGVLDLNKNFNLISKKIEEVNLNEIEFQKINDDIVYFAEKYSLQNEKLEEMKRLAAKKYANLEKVNNTIEGLKRDGLELLKGLLSILNSNINKSRLHIVTNEAIENLNSINYLSS